MLKLYRPYVDIRESVKCLDDKDCAVMKLNASLLIYVINEKMGWVEKTNLSEMYKDDEFVMYYYNAGHPKYEVLLEYYTEVYIQWMTHNGSIVEYIEHEVEEFCKINKKILAKDNWLESQALLHKMYLLKRNPIFYKRKFRDLYTYKIENYDLFTNGKPRKLDKSELVQFRDNNKVDHLLGGFVEK